MLQLSLGKVKTIVFVLIGWCTCLSASPISAHLWFPINWDLPGYLVNNGKWLSEFHQLPQWIPWVDPIQPHRLVCVSDVAGHCPFPPGLQRLYSTPHPCILAQGIDWVPRRAGHTIKD